MNCSPNAAITPRPALKIGALQANHPLKNVVLADTRCTCTPDCELVDAIITMLHKLNINVVVEGVETREQLEVLRWHKCDEIQGYYLRSPVDSDTLLTSLTDNTRKSLAGFGR